MDYGGRSPKGQTRHAERVARQVVIIDGGTWMLRRPGEHDREVDPTRLVEELCT
jgi:hypothetical protein